jgi:signal transduction histidine kinase
MGGGMGPGMGPGMMGRGGAFHGAVLRAEVQLRDGRWARFDTEQPEAPQALPLRLALTLAVLLVSVLALSYVAMRWTVRPLQQLTAAAEGLGRDLDRPPLAEDGPREVRQAARAFNTMQQRLATYVNDRTRVLTALSHDLKTPLTRLRLRAELLDDDELRSKLEADLGEMQTMVQQTLDFMRGLKHGEPPAPVDVDALLAGLQADQAALGRTLAIEGRTRGPWTGSASLLRRCLGNLVDNAALYGGGATVRIEDTPMQLSLHVLDQGPGIPEAELERVFEPFYRLEASRSRATGGSGLGLGIARNIARGFGGDLVLRNRPEGGLEAVLTLPCVR